MQKVWFDQTLYAFAFFGVLAVLLVAPWVNLQFRRFGHFRGWPAVVSSLIVLYACALIAFTMFPLPHTTPGYCARHAGRSYWQLTPFASLDDVTAYAQTHSLTQTLASHAVLQVVMNVVFFVPLGFLAAYRYRARWWTAVLVAFGVSLAIEVTQGTGLYGLAECPYRLADVDDLLVNTLGGLLGWALARLVGRFLPDPYPVRQQDLAPPGLARRLVGALLDASLYLLGMLAVLVPLDALNDDPASGSGGFTGLSLLVSVVLFVGWPLLARGRATPGELSVRVRPVRADEPDHRASVASVVVLWAVRWLPVVVFGLLALVVVLALDGIVAARRSDRRTLSEVIARVRTRTVDAVRSESTVPETLTGAASA